MGMLTSQITHIIFDLDGLLLDSETVYTRVNAEMMKKYGKVYTMELKAKTTGMKMDDAIRVMLEDEDLIGTVTVHEYREGYMNLLGEYLPDVQLLPGAIRLVKHFTKYKFPMAMCTGSDTFEFNAKMKNQKELKQNDAQRIQIHVQVLTGDDPYVKKGKPEPDGYLETMRRFPIRPKSAANVLVFEDSANGVRAAIKAGMHVVMVPDLRYSKPPEECREKIIFVLDSLEEFMPEAVGLPAFD